MQIGKKMASGRVPEFGTKFSGSLGIESATKYPWSCDTHERLEMNNWKRLNDITTSYWQLF